MLRSFFWLCIGVLCTSPSSSADEPKRLFVIVPDQEMAIAVAKHLPGMRFGILQEQMNEADEKFNERAVALQDATHLIFDPRDDTPRLAMFRERLQMQGVVVISLRSSAQTGFKIPRSIVPNRNELVARLIASIPAAP